METNEQAQRERYQEVERTLVKLVEEIEGIEDGDVKELEQKIYKGVLELGRKLFQCRIVSSQFFGGRKPSHLVEAVLF